MKKYKVFVGVLALVITSLSLTACTASNSQYIKNLVKSGIFANDYSSLVHQTSIKNLISNHLGADINTKEKKALFIMLESYQANSLEQLKPYNNGIAKVMNNGYAYLSSANVKTKQKATINGSTNGLGMLLGIPSEDAGVLKATDQKPTSPLTLISELGTSNKTVLITERDNLIKTLMKQEIDLIRNDGNNGSKFIDTDKLLLMQNEMMRAISINDLVVGLYSETDYVGRNNSYNVKNGKYMNAVCQINTYINELLTLIENGENYANEDWLIIIASTNGGLDMLNNVENETTFIVSNKKIA